MYVSVYENVRVCAHVYVYDLPQKFHVFATSLTYIRFLGEHETFAHGDIFYVIVNRQRHHNIRNGIVWVQNRPQHMHMYGHIVCD